MNEYHPFTPEKSQRQLLLHVVDRVEYFVGATPPYGPLRPPKKSVCLAGFLGSDCLPLHHRCDRVHPGDAGDTAQSAEPDPESQAKHRRNHSGYAGERAAEGKVLGPGRRGQAEASGRCSSVIGGQRTPPPNALDCDVSMLPEQKEHFHSAEPTPLQPVTVNRLRGALAVPGFTLGISWGKRWAEHS